MDSKQIPHDSQPTLNLLWGYDTFLESLTTICDMGCGTSSDITWWATLETKDEIPEPYNYKCYAVDTNKDALTKVPDLENIIKVPRDFTEKRILSTDIDLMWSHDSLQYSHNPLQTLSNWQTQMSPDGMLCLAVPQACGVVNNTYSSRTYNNQYYNHTPTSLIYMLATAGFDCKDLYLLKRAQDPWIHIACYKSEYEPMDPQTTTWFDLANKGMLHYSVEDSLNKYGYVAQEELVIPWLDKENYFVDWVMPSTEMPDVTVIDTNQAPQKPIKMPEGTLKQGNNNKGVVKGTPLLEPTKLMRAPKQVYKKR